VAETRGSVCGGGYYIMGRLITLLD